MNGTPTKIVVTVQDQERATALSLMTSLPFLPATDTLLTVETDEPFPLHITLVSFNITKQEIFISAHVPAVERERPDGRVDPIMPSEVVALLISAGFTVTEVVSTGALWAMDRPRRKRRRRGATR